jgi:hypothetical protein
MKLMRKINVIVSDEARDFILKQDNKVAIRMQLVNGC